jgi:hypothetical protein
LSQRSRKEVIFRVMLVNRGPQASYDESVADGSFSGFSSLKSSLALSDGGEDRDKDLVRQRMLRNSPE